MFRFKYLIKLPMIYIYNTYMCVCMFPISMLLGLLLLLDCIKKQYELSYIIGYAHLSKYSVNIISLSASMLVQIIYLSH